MKLGESGFSVLSFGRDNFVVTLKGVQVHVEGKRLDELIIIFRLLTMQELNMVNRFFPEETDGSSASFAMASELEEEIFHRCVVRIIGIDDIKNIDLNEFDAGIIPSISGIILKKSFSHINDIQRTLDNYIGTITQIDQMELVVCRYYNMTYKEVSELPIDQLFQKFQTFNMTFPSEAVTKQEDQSNDDE